MGNWGKGSAMLILFSPGEYYENGMNVETLKSGYSDIQERTSRCAELHPNRNQAEHRSGPLLVSNWENKDIVSIDCTLFRKPRKIDGAEGLESSHARQSVCKRGSSASTIFFSAVKGLESGRGTNLAGWGLPANRFATGTKPLKDLISIQLEYPQPPFLSLRFLIWNYRQIA